MTAKMEELEVKNVKTDVLSILYFTVPFILLYISNIILHMSDRLMLSWYDLQAGVEVASAMNVVNLFFYAPNTLLGILTLIVGNYNGANEYGRIGRNIWNAIWLACFCALINYLFLSTSLYEYLISDVYTKYGDIYVRIVLSNIIFMYIDTVLSCFFFGIGRSYLVTYVIWLGAILNVIFNYILIFMCDYGAAGGAYATMLATLIKVVILLYYYLRCDDKYHLLDMKFDFLIIKDIVYRGSSSALGHSVELVAIGFVYVLLASYGENNGYLQVGFVINMFAIVLININTGFEKAISTLASNYFGNKDHMSILRALKSICIVFVIFFIGMSIISIVFIDNILHFLNFDINNIDDHLYSALVYSVKITVFFAFFDGTAWMIVGVLHSIKDIMFSFLVNAGSIILFYLLPSYIIYLYIPNPEYYFAAEWFLVYTLVHMLALMYRFYDIFYSKLLK